MEKSMGKEKKYVSGTGEWASHSVNIQSGCEHNCLYCYARTNAARYDKHDPRKWGKPVINQASVSQGRGKKTGTVMFPTAHDITPENVSDCIVVLKKLVKAGNKVLIVSKPHLSCIQTICSALDGFQDNVLFRFTIGSANDDVLKKWEPGAPPFAERLGCLRMALINYDFATSVSCEPMLDQHIEDVIDAVRPWVTDAIWLGKPNKMTTRLEMNNPDNPDAKAMAKDLEDLFPDAFIWNLYRMYKDDPMIKWKDSIKQVVGLKRHTEKGLDR
jgi:DNA repair photolyase